MPGALTDVAWEDWSAATRLAVREARRRVDPSAPLHLVGYSTGGALAVQYALDALGDRTLTRPDRIVLISPMIGVTTLARFAGLFGLPAVLPAFAKAAWLSVVPEFNPFKYNSFPINGARQSSRLARALQQQIAGGARENRLGDLPPVLTFQSVVDFTVSTRAIVAALYVHLPANGSELVLFDLNRSATFGPFLRPRADAVLTGLLPDPPRPFRTAVITNASPERREVVEHVTEAGATAARSRALGSVVPLGRVFALPYRPAVSHQRWPVWPGARSGRALRRAPGGHGRAGRARHPDRESGLADASVVEPVLPVPARTGRGRPGSPPPGQRGTGRRP